MASIATSTSASAPSVSRSIGRGRFAKIGIATVVAATIVNVIAYYIFGLFVDYNPDFVVLSTPGGTIFYTVVCSIVAVAVYGALVRFTANPVRNFKITAAVVLVLSFVPDIAYIPTVEGSDNPQIVVLMLLHVVAAAVIVPMLTTLARPDDR